MSVSLNMSGFLICANLLDSVSLFFFMKNLRTECSVLFINEDIFFFPPASGDIKYTVLVYKRADVRA